MNVITKHPRINSQDYHNPCGAKQDNHSNEVYIKEICQLFNNAPFSYLDLGCAGGQSVIDIAQKGYVSAGIDGCGKDRILEVSTSEGVTNNWTRYSDKNLFSADISQPFRIVDENNQAIKFDLITAWDFLEHPTQDEIPQVISNIKGHLSQDGWFICLIAKSEAIWHQCVKTDQWWIESFTSRGFDLKKIPITSNPRTELIKPNREEFVGAFKLCQP